MKRTPPNPLLDRRKTRHASTPTSIELLMSLRKMEEETKALAEKLSVKVPKPPPAKNQLPEPQIQVLLRMVEKSLRDYGDVIPPREVFYLTEEKKCPKCDLTKNILEGFGLKSTGQPHSWCGVCRGSKAAHPGRYR